MSQRLAAHAIAELHVLANENGPTSVRIRLDRLDSDLSERESMSGAATGRAVPTVHDLSGDDSTLLRRAERDWLADLRSRIESGDTAWPTL